MEKLVGEPLGVSAPLDLSKLKRCTCLSALETANTRAPFGLKNSDPVNGIALPVSRRTFWPASTCKTRMRFRTASCTNRKFPVGSNCIFPESLLMLKQASVIAEVQ